MNMSPDMVIIGTGMGGATLAAGLAATGSAIVVLERGEQIPDDADRSVDEDRAGHTVRHATDGRASGHPSGCVGRTRKTGPEWGCEHVFVARTVDVRSVEGGRRCGRKGSSTWWASGRCGGGR